MVTNVVTKTKKVAYKSEKTLDLAERVGFEPTVPCGTPDFESEVLSVYICRFTFKN